MEGLEKTLSNNLNYRVGKVRAVNIEDNTEYIALVNRRELDTLLDTDAPECTALVWLQGEFKDALFGQMLKDSQLIGRHCPNSHPDVVRA